METKRHLESVNLSIFEKHHASLPSYHCCMMFALQCMHTESTCPIPAHYLLKKESEWGAENVYCFDEVIAPESLRCSHPRCRVTTKGLPKRFCVYACVGLCVYVCGFQYLLILQFVETSNRRVMCFQWTPQQQYVSFPDNTIRPCSSH